MGLAPLGVSCGGTPATSCPAVPSSCPSPVPSYATDVAPIIQQLCVPCHAPMGLEPKQQYETYAEVKSFEMDILFKLRGCTDPMPPVGSPPLSDAQRATLVGWLYCDAPNN
jgi:hypothetical protein